MVTSVVYPAEVVQIEPNGDVVVQVAADGKSWRLVCDLNAFAGLPYPDLGDTVLLEVDDGPAVCVVGVEPKQADLSGEPSPQELAKRWHGRNPFGGP